MWKHVKTCEKNMWRSFEIGTDQRRPWRWILLKWRRPRCCDDWCGSGVGVEGGYKFEMVYRVYIYTYVFTLLDWFEPIHRKWASFVSGCFGRYCRSCWIMMDIYIYTYILYQYAKYVKIPDGVSAPWVFKTLAWPSSMTWWVALRLPFIFGFFKLVPLYFPILSFPGVVPFNGRQRPKTYEIMRHSCPILQQSTCTSHQTCWGLWGGGIFDSVGLFGPKVIIIMNICLQLACTL